MIKRKKFLVIAMKFKVLLLGLALFPAVFFGMETEEFEVIPVATELKVRMPEWHPKVLEQFQNGAPKLVVFYFENDQGIEEPVKRIHFYESGRPMEETDLTFVDENSRGFLTW